MKKLVVANLKMNLDYEASLNYAEYVKHRIDDSLDVVICPTYPYLYMFKGDIRYKIGAQNVYYMDKGAFTGEVSIIQLKTFGITHAIVGHSERRSIFGETDDLINKKVLACLKHNIKPILCIGETLEEKQLNRTAIVLKKQILNDLKGIEVNDLNDIIVAYEPVWAIGSGKVPTINEIDDAVKYIKQIINSEYGREIKVLYGGSIDKTNIKDIMNIKVVDGTLIGGASQDPVKFINMLEIIEKNRN